MPLKLFKAIPGPSHQGADNGTQGNPKTWAPRQLTAVCRGTNSTKYATKSEQRPWGHFLGSITNLDWQCLKVREPRDFVYT